jgi:pilus assembly protein FimV
MSIGIWPRNGGRGRGLGLAERLTALVLAAAALAAAAPAAAVGLGAIEVESGLNEPLRARVPLAGLAPGEAVGLTARLADDAAHARAGLDGPRQVRGLRFSTVPSGEHSAHVLVTSDAVLREPSFSFVLEVEGDGGTLQRRYDVLLNLR